MRGGGDGGSNSTSPEGGASGGREGTGRLVRLVVADVAEERESSTFILAAFHYSIYVCMYLCVYLYVFIRWHDLYLIVEELLFAPKIEL